MTKLTWHYRMMSSLLLILFVMTGCTTGEGGFALSTVLTEEEINADLVDTSIYDFSNLFVDLVPDEMNIYLTANRARRTIEIIVTATVVVDDNTVVVSVTEISTDTGELPTPLVARVNAEVVPTVNEAINENIPVGQVQSVTITDTEMTVTIGNFFGGD